MNKVLNVVSLALAIVALVFAVQARNQTTNAPATEVVKEPFYANIIKTRTLRCSYVSFPPLTIVDPNTKALSGIFVDLVNDLGARLNLKVDWVEEVTYGTINAGFGTGRYDAFCTGLWPGSTRASNTLFSNGLFYDPVGIFVRANDNRFDGDPYKINDPAYTMTYIEGDGTESMTKAIFPKAKPLGVGQVGTGEYFGNIVTGKADAGMGTKITGVRFLESNPGTIKEVPYDHPVRVYPVTIGLPEGEFSIKKMLDAAIFEQQDDGTVERVIKKYLPDHANMLYHQKQEYVPF